MRVIKNKKKSSSSPSKKGNVWGGPSNSMGDSIFSSGKSGKKIALGRNVKPLSGPVHPGFEKSAEIYLKRKINQTSISAMLPTLQKIDQSNELYSPTGKNTSNKITTKKVAPKTTTKKTASKAIAQKEVPKTTTKKTASKTTAKKATPKKATPKKVAPKKTAKKNTRGSK